MSTTTQILFNSPALHSLKRDQLVKLCKIHNIKANGKNTDLIKRLQQKAQELPEPATEDENVAEEEEEESDVSDLECGAVGGLRNPITRPSEQWEVVMEDIEEESSSNMGTLSSMKSMRSGEFGSNTSKASVGSSLKALASSLGIKRTLSTKSTATVATKEIPASSSMPVVFPSKGDELDKHAVPYSSIPPSTSLPHTDHFKFTTPDDSLMDTTEDEPVPGSPTRPGQPAPSNGNATPSGLTTIRLITTPSAFNAPTPPRLAAYKTDFEIIMDSPGGQKAGVWPASPPRSQYNIYPDLPIEDMKDLEKFTPGRVRSPTKVPSVTITAPNGLSALPALPQDAPNKDVFSPARPPGSAARRGTLPAQPFLFGSPLPQHRRSNHDFGQAAASVLEEMNKRLEESGVPRVEKTVLERKADGSDLFGPSANTGRPSTDSVDRFAKAHEDAFSKMDSIATHYAARRGRPTQEGAPANKKRKSDALGVGPAPSAKRKSSVASHTGARVISNGVRRNMGVPGGFDNDEGVEEEEEGVQDPGDRRSSKRIRVADVADVHKGKRVSLAPTQQDREKDERKEKEREAMKRKLDAQKARRRSSRGRPSIGKATPAKTKTSRFGFLSSAKSLVRNVWNFGAGSKPAPPTPAPAQKTAPPPPKLTPATTQVSEKPAIGLGRPSSKPIQPQGLSRIASGSSETSLKPKSDHRASRSRSPLPSFSPPPQNTDSKASGSTTSRNVPSSLGARNSLASGTSGVSSVGRKSVNPNIVGGSTMSGRPETIPEEKPTSRKPSSTLMAPTASSLAKVAENACSPRGSTVPRKTSGAQSPSLRPITNSPQSPRSTTIFSKPLAGFGSPNAIPAGDRVPSLTSAATKLMNAAPAKPKSTSITNLAAFIAPKSMIPVPPRPKTLVAKKPRISRSKVIAKLGAQRAASGSSSTPTTVAPASRVRSSMGNGTRRSYAGAKANAGPGRESLLMSAKKQARKSEYARRKSRVGDGQALKRMDVGA